ncbi:hypothetical protein FKM82_027152 [Ascaphus truei]
MKISLGVNRLVGDGSAVPEVTSVRAEEAVMAAGTHAEASHAQHACTVAASAACRHSTGAAHEQIHRYTQTETRARTHIDRDAHTHTHEEFTVTIHIQVQIGKTGGGRERKFLCVLALKLYFDF